MRLKSDVIDYHYFREPNIIEIDIKYLIDYARENMSKLPHVINDELPNDGVPINIVEQLLDDYDAYKIFKYVNDEVNNTSIVISWIVVELAALLRTNNNSYGELTDEFLKQAIELLLLISGEEINGKQAKIVFEHMYKTNKNATVLIEELGIKQIKDPSVIEKFLKIYIEENPEMLAQYRQRPERVEKFFIGLLMRDTKGQANPTIAIELLKKLLD
jgi:aspartyl-tRNA(Asn)/glutamyl-tRNA(Gln) amidotransferase subunit B